MRGVPLLFFGRDRASELCGLYCRQKLWQVDFKNYIFFTSEGAHPPQTPPVHTVVEVLLVLYFGAPSYKKKSWIRSCSCHLSASKGSRHLGASRGSREENFGSAKLMGRGLRPTFFNFAPGCQN